MRWKIVKDSLLQKRKIIVFIEMTVSACVGYTVENWDIFSHFHLFNAIRSNHLYVLHIVWKYWEALIYFLRGVMLQRDPLSRFMRTNCRTSCRHDHIKCAHRISGNLLSGMSYINPYVCNNSTSFSKYLHRQYRS